MPIAISIERSQKAVYRFEDIEVDPSLGYLKRSGEEQHLRQQSFHLLLYMIERPQALIRKEDLIENFWQGAAVTDNAVVQCIKEIRRALGDDPREPRFIKTIHKIGYRFIAAVTEEPLLTEAGQGLEIKGADSASDAIADHRLLRWRTGWPIPVLVALAGIIIAGWALFGHPARQSVELMLPQAPGKKALAVMYFENQSSRPDLNWLSEGLADMFIADLAHFDRLTVLSRQQLHLLLARIGSRYGNGTQLDGALAIARKSHAQDVLLGSFGALGDKKILVGVRLFETASGELLSADQFVVDEPADLLTQVDVLSPKLAARLGIAPLESATQAGLADVMTKNLEAYRYYSLGVSKAQAFQNAQAVALLRKAIQLDPKFAMAYARIGYAYSVTDFLPDEGRPFLAKAMELSGRLTSKDRLYVTAWYAIARRDYAGAIRTLQQIVDQYPNEIEAYTRLARLLNREERPRETIAVVQRALAVDPDYGDLYNVLGACLLGLGRYDEAIAAHQRYVQLAPNEPNAHDSLGMSYQQSGSYDRAVAEYDAALSEDPEFEPAIIHLGDVYFQQGRYRGSGLAIPALHSSDRLGPGARGRLRQHRPSLLAEAGLQPRGTGSSKREPVWERGRLEFAADRAGTGRDCESGQAQGNVPANRSVSSARLPQRTAELRLLSGHAGAAGEAARKSDRPFPGRASASAAEFGTGPLRRLPGERIPGPGPAG